MARKQTSGWPFLFAGIIIGLFISFVFYLKNKEPDELREQVGIRQSAAQNKTPVKTRATGR